MTPALSPSRAADFKQCPLLFRFRTIDKLEGPRSPAAARGTLVHAVLEHLFDLPAADRTPAAAVALLAPRWSALVEERPELKTMIDDDELLTEEGWFAAPYEDRATVLRRAADGLEWRTDKVVDLIVEKAKVKDQKVTKDDLLKDDDLPDGYDG